MSVKTFNLWMGLALLAHVPFFPDAALGLVGGAAACLLSWADQPERKPSQRGAMTRRMSSKLVVFDGDHPCPNCNYCPALNDDGSLPRSCTHCGQPLA